MSYGPVQRKVQAQAQKGQFHVYLEASPKVPAEMFIVLAIIVQDSMQYQLTHSYCWPIPYSILAEMFIPLAMTIAMIYLLKHLYCYSVIFGISLGHYWYHCKCTVWLARLNHIINQNCFYHW